MRWDDRSGRTILAMAATAIVMAFEDAEPAVYRWRRAHTTDGAEGMPAHVTLIYPFAEDSDLVTGQVSELRELLSAFPAFDVRFATFGRFDGPPPVLYLEPAPAQPFIDMVDAVVRQFPSYQPFGGEYDTVIPHLTVVQTDDQAVVAAAEEDVAEHLPLVARAGDVRVMEHDRSEGWRTLHLIRLS